MNTFQVYSLLIGLRISRLAEKWLNAHPGSPSKPKTNENILITDDFGLSMSRINKCEFGVWDFTGDKLS